VDVFTGLVEGLGRLEQAILENGGRRLTIAWPGLPASEPLQLGESVAVSGCCLTVVAATGETFETQVGPETLDRTNLGTKSAGDRVNLERALKVGARLGGHFVQGHIDTTATLRERRQEGEWEFLAFRIESTWTPLLVSKGSIAVDGVSLTLVDVWPDAFSVMLIPHTMVMTTLGSIRPGDPVNIEIDMLAKHVQKLLGK
jgi:riboflavin synthase